MSSDAARHSARPRLAGRRPGRGRLPGHRRAVRPDHRRCSTATTTSVRSPTSGSLAAVLVILVAPLVGGAVAGAAQPRAPLSHGAAAVYVPGRCLSRRAQRGRRIVQGSLTARDVVSFLLFLMVFTGLGVVGGYLAFRPPVPAGLSQGGSAISILVVDVGTSGVRAAIVGPDGAVDHVHHRPVLPATPAPGLVEFDAAALAAAALDVARAALAEGGPVDAVGIANQRASTIVWDRATGEPVGPGHRLAGPAHRRHLPHAARPGHPAGAQRVGDQARLPARHRRLSARERDLRVRHGRHLDRLAPLRGHRPRHRRLQRRGHRPAAGRRLRLVGQSARRAAHSRARAAHRGRLVGPRRRRPPPCPAPRRSPASPATSRPRSSARAAPGPGWPRSPSAPAACSTCAWGPGPAFDVRGEGGCFPIVAWRRAGRLTWGVEAIMLSAGNAVEWLRDDLGIIDSAAESEAVAGRVRRQRRGVLRPRPARSGHAPLGLRGAGHAARPHPRHRPARGGPGRARGRRPPGRRPVRGGRDRRRPRGSTPSGSTAA